MLGLAVNLSLYKASLFMVREPHHERAGDGWFESLTTNGRGLLGWLGLDSCFHGNDGVGPLAVRMVRGLHQERTALLQWQWLRFPFSRE